MIQGSCRFSPDPSPRRGWGLGTRLSPFLRATLNRWEWPGNEATHVHMHVRGHSAVHARGNDHYRIPDEVCPHTIGNDRQCYNLSANTERLKPAKRSMCN